MGNIQFFPQVDFGTGITTSYILIECEKEDFEPCVNAISNALIFTDIIPSQADRAVVSRQHKKRLENGSVVNQMIGHSYKLLFPNSSLEKIFEYKTSGSLSSGSSFITGKYRRKYTGGTDILQR